MKKYITLLLAMLMVVSMFTMAGCSQQGTSTSQPGGATAGTSSNTSDDLLAGVDMKPVNWSFASHLGSTNDYYLMEVDFAERVYERTNGLVNITVYASGELPYSPTDFARVVGDGTIEMAGATLSYISGECPTSSVVAFPMLAGEVESLDKALDAAKPFINEEMSAKGIEVIGFSSTPMQTVFGVGNAPHTLADLKGRKLRTFDAYQSELLSSYGVTPVSMVMSEVLPSLQKNTIDCALTGVVGAAAARWDDVITWAYLLPFAASSEAILVNEAALASLPDPIREIVLEEGENFTAANREYASTQVEAAIKSMEDNGVEIIWPSDEDIQELTDFAATFWPTWAGDSQNMKDCLEAVRAAVGK